MYFSNRRPYLIAIVFVFSITLANGLRTPAASKQFAVNDNHKLPAQEHTAEVTGLETRVVNDNSARLVHAPSIVQLQSGGLITTWWGGSREGGKDVQIYTAFFNPETQNWEESRVIQSAKTTQAQAHRYIRKLGNAVITQDPKGKLHLFYVSVSVGGWAASSINWITSADEGDTWSESRRLITAPFLNLSTLVKGTPIFYDDGSIGLPVYHEFAGKFGEMLQVSPSGKVLGKTRLSKGRDALQPVIHTLSKTDARILLRYAGDGDKKVLLTSTTDGGKLWSEPTPINIANPNSAVALVHHNSLGEIGVFNDLTSGRERLNLYRYGTNNQWAFLHSFEDKTKLKGQLPTTEDYNSILTKDLENYLTPPERKKQIIAQAIETMCYNNQCEFQYDYPYLIQGNNNRYHLVYTWNKSSIKHISFTLPTLDKPL